MPNHVTNRMTVVGEGAHEFLMSCFNKQGNFDFNKVIPIPKELDIPESSWVEDLAYCLRGKLPRFSHHQTVEEAYSELKKRMAGEFKQHVQWAKQYNENLEKYGYGTWFGANRDAWGTKWNAYSQSYGFKLPSERNVGKRRHGRYRPHATAYFKRVKKKLLKRNMITSVEFDTAWSTPEGVWKAMIGILPQGLTVSVQFADEDTGSNCGSFTITPDGFADINIAPSWGDMSDAEKTKWTEFAFRLTRPESDPREYGYDENWVYSEEVYEAYEAEQAS